MYINSFDLTILILAMLCSCSEEMAKAYSEWG